MFVTTRVVYKAFGQTNRAQSFHYPSNAKPNIILRFVRKTTDFLNYFQMSGSMISRT